MTQSNIWTEHEIAKLRQLSGTMSSAEIGKILGRTKDAVKSQRNRWGLPSYVRVYGTPTETVEAAPVSLPVAPKAVPVVLRKVSGPPLRQKAPSREWPPLEYCPECGAPVSNWEEHHQRMGHRRQA